MPPGARRLREQDIPRAPGVIDPAPGAERYWDISDGAQLRTIGPRDFQRFSEISFLAILGVSRGAPGAQILPKCGPGPWLNFGRVSAKSALWRPHSWPKFVFAECRNSANRTSLRGFRFIRIEIVRI